MWVGIIHCIKKYLILDRRMIFIREFANSSISAIFMSHGTISEISADFVRKPFNYCVWGLGGVPIF